MSARLASRTAWTVHGMSSSDEVWGVYILCWGICTAANVTLIHISFGLSQSVCALCYACGLLFPLPLPQDQNP